MMSGCITKVQNIKKENETSLFLSRRNIFHCPEFKYMHTHYLECISFILVCGVAKQGGCVWIRIREFALKNNMFCTCMLP